MSTRMVYAVMWDCNYPRPVAVFDSREDAQRLCDDFKRNVDALFQRMGLTGDERIYVWETPMNPNVPAEKLPPNAHVYERHGVQ